MPSQKNPLPRLLLHLAVFFTSISAMVHGHGFNVLVFTKTSGENHTSIPAGITALTELGVEHDFGVTQTADATTFVSQLATHQVVVFLNTTGDVLNASQQTAFQNWYQSGRGFIAIHAAADAEPGWTWYQQLIGASIDSAAPVQSGTIKILDQVHPITRSGDPQVQEWTMSDEWYNFTDSPRGRVHVLGVVDELVTTTNPFGESPDTGITGGTHGNDHPILWCHEFDGGRSAYLGPGHQDATYSDSVFRDIMVNSIEWAAGETGGDSGATIDDNWEKVILDANLSNPMSIDVAPDGQIYLIERFGAVKRHNEDTGTTTTIGTLDEYSGGEYGGLGIALAPDFESSGHLYLLWSPNAGTNTRISRFTLDPSGNLNLSSEVVVLEFLTNRVDSGHHQAGCIRFDADGNLVAALGDNTQASGYSPRNEGSIGRDARKSAPNTNDLRGKIIRITPNINGGPAEHPHYTIPTGNLFPASTPLARPEIYAMGCRNPFRFCIDPVTGWLYYGDVGPDATDTSNGNYQGPGGHDEFNQVKAAGWFGWPYFIGDNKPYLDGNGNPWTTSTYQSDLANYFTLPTFTGSGASAGDPSLVTNPQPAWIWYPDAEGAPAFSEVGASSGRCALAGAVYQYVPGHNMPKYYDGSVFLLQWSRNRILEVKNRPDGSILEITEFAPDLSFSRPHEMVFGPNGAMYVIEWGTGDLAKVQYTQAAATPVTVASSDVSSGATPLTVQFSSAGTYDPDSVNLSYAWDFDGDQVTDSTEPNPQHVFTHPGNYMTQLTVTDDDGLFSRANLPITVGNFAPTIQFAQPLDFSFFDWGDTLRFEFNVTDVEDGSSADGSITGADVLFEGSLGHADHQHNEVQANTLEGTLWIPRDESHPFDLDLSYVLDAYYTDQGAPGVDPVQTSERVHLQPKITMAQTFDGQSGVSLSPTLDPVGGDVDVVSIDHGDHLYFSGFNLAQIETIRLRASAAGSGGNVEIRQDSPTGNLIGTVNVSPTGAAGAFQDFETPVSNVTSGSHDLYFVFTESPGSSDLMRLNWIGFRGQSATREAGRPSVIAASTVATHTLRIEFDQAMDSATLASAANYSVDHGATILSVNPAGDQTSVDLQLGNVVENDYYTISMSGIEDLAGDAIPAGTEATVLMQAAAVTTFEIGLNAGGPDFTDSSGNLYIADNSPPVDRTLPVTLLVDMMRINNPQEANIVATAADFAMGDAQIDLTASVTAIDEANSATPIPLTGTHLTGATLTTTGATNSFTTNKGNLDDLPIFDGYVYNNSTTPATTTLSGLGDITAGSPITLTLWGVGDSANSDNEFTVIHDGSTVGTQTTDYDSATPEDTSPARVQFTFPKVGGADSITIEWGKASAGGTAAGFNGLSLTSFSGTLGPDDSYVSGGTRTRTYGSPIAGTDDDVLYQSERSRNGNFTYGIPVQPGTYDVLLRFAENYWNNESERLFNVSIEGGPNEFNPSLDLIARSGAKNQAYDQLFSGIQVTDNLLEVELIDTAVDGPKLSAIGIFKETTSISPLPNPSFALHLEQNPQSQQSAVSDADGDGVTTLLEYALGGSDDSRDTQRLPVLEPAESGEFSLVFSRPTDLPDVTYSISASDDLVGWTTISPLEETVSQGGMMEEVRMRNLVAASEAVELSTDQSLYFRLEVELVSPSP